MKYLLFITSIVSVLVGLRINTNYEEELNQGNVRLNTRLKLERDKQDFDNRVQRTKAFLKDTQLEEYSELLVRVADKYGADYKLILAIGSVESNLGRNAKDYNAFGIGGTNYFSFNSYEESIEYVTRLIATNGYYKDFQRTKSLEDLAKVYCTSEKPEVYANKLRYFIDKI